MAIKCGRGYGAFQQPRGGNLASDRVQRRLTAILAADVAGYKLQSFFSRWSIKFSAEYYEAKEQQASDVLSLSSSGLRTLR